MNNVMVPENYVYAVECLLNSLELAEIRAGEIDAHVITVCIKSLKEATTAKINAIEKRKAFTEYKTAGRNTVEREELRETYLELAGIIDDFKSAMETRV